MIGQTVGHFRILSRLGSGGMGVVYRAHDEKLQREIAIKMMSGESDRPDLDRLRIIEEARAASGLSHPHICTVYETGEFQGQAYIAMEYVQGRALSEMIPAGGLPSEGVIRYGIQVADALSHAHRRGIIHRDLKTSNVVVDGEGRAKVLDFGLARRIALKTGAAVTRSSDLMPDNKLVGTLAYMAPEMLLHQTADERSDIWGLGVMLYEMASGEPPFKGRNEFEITAGILRTPAEALPAHVPPMLRAIIQRCIAKDPGQRYQHAGEARAALEAIQSDAIAPPASSGHSGVIARPADSGPVLTTSKTPTRAIAIVVAVLTLGAVAAVLWVRRDTRSVWERVASGGQLTQVVGSDEPLVDPSLSFDGKMLAYVAVDKQGTSDVFVRRVAGGSLIRITNDRAREGAPRFSPDGERLAFTKREDQNGPPEIRIVPTLGGDAIATIPAAGDPRWSPSGTELAFLRPTISGGTQLVVAGVNGSNARVVLEPDSTFPFLRDPAWAPDGEEIAIVRGSGGIAGEIWLVPVNGGAPRRAMSDPPEVSTHSPAYTADGLGIVHSSNRGGATNIWFYPRRGGAPVRLTAGPGPDMSPTVAADGTISFINSRWRNTLDVFSLRGAAPRVLMSHSPYIWGPSFSRDGKTIAFSRSEVDGSWHIWTIPAEGGTPKRVSDTPSGEVYSRFTADRASILFHTWGTPRRVGRVPIDGGTPQMLNFGSASDAFPDMSPDGKWIAVTRTDADAEHVYIAPAGGGTPRLLTKSAGSVPRWSPDGRQIAFGANRNSTGGIFVIDADGKNERRLTSTGGWPVWWPDGRQIGFMVPGRSGGQEIHVVNRETGATRHLAEIVFSGSNHPFDVSPDGTRLVTSNAVHVSDEIWLLEPRVRQ
jgi:Tol biopolymer transport system component/predicted Ser/Thr protein kinase